MPNPYSFIHALHCEQYHQRLRSTIMQVGDWVEFQTIVVKRRHTDGSAPATKTLTRRRRGMVIGARYVYDATADTPPALSNPQQVLLVAVSLHRCYRVYPSDVQPTTPPR